MKKLITIFAAIALLAVSCQQEDIINNDEGIGITTGITTGKLTARFASTTTRVGYTVMDYIYIGEDDWEWPYDYDDDDDHYMGLLPAWEVGDEIIGFDDDGNTYTLTVASIDAGTATLSGTVPDGNLHLIYKYGAQASDISNKTLAVDYSGQVGDKTMPAVMLADGTVVGGSCDFIFTNAGAVIGVWFMDGLPLGSKVTQVTLSGENLSAATIALDGSNKLTLTATENAEDAITINGLDLTVVEDDDWGNILNSPVWIAVPGEAVIEKVTLTVPTSIESRTWRIPSETSDYVTIGGKKWAKWNIGAYNEKDYGWYFAWGDVIGYFRNEMVWLYDGITSFDFKYCYVPKSSDFPYDPLPYTASAGKYCMSEGTYSKDEDQTAHIYDWENTPFNNGTPENPDHTYFNGIKNTVCDGNWNLVSTYDAAHVIWGGTWRMPTEKDFMDLIVACGGTYVKRDYSEEILRAERTPTELPSANPGKGIYWVSADQAYIPDYTGVAGVLFCDGTSKLFFPAAGFGTSNDNSMNFSVYWSSSLYQPSGTACGNAIALSLRDYAVKTDFIIRMYGMPIRPVSD